MAVFRIEKTQNYTVMSNHHLRNKDLSLKAKGLLSQMLSLPEEWDYTLKGLSHINRESVDAIRAAVRELEQAGYITRSRERKDNGQLGGAEYIIHEQPPDDNLTPTRDKPILENPTQVNPALENPTQLNKDISSKEKSITDLSIPVRSPREREDGAGQETKNITAFEIYRDIIRDNIDYDILTERYPNDKERIDEITDLILETVCTARKTVRISGDDYPAEYVKAKLIKLNAEHIEFVLDRVKENTTKIRNIKKYLLAALFNAPSTIDSYYTSLVAHDKGAGLC